MNSAFFTSALNAINRTFLFFNDRKGLENFTGLNFSNNNTAAKFSFEKRYNAFQKLSSEAKNICNLDLKEVLEDYEKISGFISESKKTITKESDIYEIIDDFISDDDITDYSLKIALSVLILTGLLPKFSSRKGNVENIAENFEKFYLLIENYCKATGKQDFGYIDIHLEQFQQTDTKDLSRIMLISIAADVLKTIKNYNNAKSRFVATKNFQNAVYDLEGIYCSTEDDNVNDFWTLEYDENEGKNYFLTHCFTNNNRAECIYYQAVITNYLSLKHLTVMSEKFSRTLCENGSAENEQALFWLEISDKKLTFERISSKGFDIDLTTLYRKENIASYLPKIENSVLITDPKFLYTKEGKLSAVTEDFLLFDLPDNVKTALKTSETMLKIPRTGDLQNYENINDDICFVIFGDRKVYLAFYNLNKFLDVTGML